MESKKLSEVVKENVGRPTYDYLLIDCPPALSLLTINALVAADAVLILVKTDPGAGEENSYPRRAQRDLILPPAAPLSSPMRLSYVPISQAKRASVFSLTVDKFVPKSVSMMMEKFVPKEAAETKPMMAMEPMPTKAPADVDRASSGLG
jgi:hypothetical protein